MFADVNLAVYLGGVTLIAVIAYAWLHVRVSSFKDSRVSRIRELVKEPEATSAMPTDVLSDKEEQREQRQIIRGVKSRFTIIRRGLTLCVAAVWVLAMIFPFVGRLPSTMLSIVIAISTAVIGIAARPLVENMISGIVISFSKQLRVGDTLSMDGQYGTVEDISITHTKIKTWDWKRYVIPNSRMLNKEFVNLTLNDSLLWAYLEFSVSYEADLDEVGRLAVKVAGESRHHNSQEEAAVLGHAHGPPERGLLGGGLGRFARRGVEPQERHRREPDPGLPGAGHHGPHRLRGPAAHGPVRRVSTF